MTSAIELPERLSQELDRLLGALIADASVRSVILFGSTARGTRHERSDIDLLIVIDGAQSDQATIASRIRRETFGMLSLPLDLIIESAKDFEERSALPTLERKIAREGKVLYAA